MEETRAEQRPERLTEPGASEPREFDASNYGASLRALGEAGRPELREPVESTRVGAEDLVGRPRNEVEPHRYIAPGEEIQRRLEEHRSTAAADEFREWVPQINPKYSEFPSYRPEAIPWTNNCGDCSRRFADAYQGLDVHAAYGDGKAGPGEVGEMWEWAGVRPVDRARVRPGESHEEFTAAAWDKLGRSLEGQPVGTVAIVGVDWHDPRRPDGRAGGHWFNAVRTSDGVKWVDAQSGEWSDWPPGYRTQIWQMEAVVRRHGEAWKAADLG
jgi:hypothetical protein